ncbi:MAG TPA: DnaA regulatory inactivator Hda [Steroidobacteraceae bacterium]|nr:DnaA regulatory inactivator Hda [Steroidobacteraceae bacterium]
MRQLPLGVRVPDRAVFASFLPGPNVQAVEHLKSLARGTLGGMAWICGPSGAGKSHLLQASCALASERARAGYLPLREVARLGVGALEGLNELDCLCLDDLDVVLGDGAWERALFALHCQIDERGGRLIAASGMPPALVTWTLGDLGSRWAASAVFQLRPLEEEQLTQALQLRAQVRGLELPEETARWLQRRFPRDMRTLYELLDTLDEAALVERRKLTVPFIRSVLSCRAQP